MHSQQKRWPQGVAVECRRSSKHSIQRELWTGRSCEEFIGDAGESFGNVVVGTVEVEDAEMQAVEEGDHLSQEVDGLKQRFPLLIAQPTDGALQPLGESRSCWEPSGVLRTEPLAGRLQVQLQADESSVQQVRNTGVKNDESGPSASGRHPPPTGVHLDNVNVLLTQRLKTCKCS